MALYDIEIIRTPKAPKALKQICTLTGISEREIKDALQTLPFTVKRSIPLSEAIETERQLKRLGIFTRVVKVDAGPDHPDIEDAEDFDIVDSELASNEDEIIEIPEEEVTVLASFQPAEPKVKVKKKKVFVPKRETKIILFIASISAFVAISWYILQISKNRQNEMEISLSIDQYRHVLLQQDILLDKGFPPERIFYQIDEIESKIERLISLIKSIDKAAYLRSDFTKAKEETQSLVRDLAFRRSLEDHGYPIHPTCLLDRGMVRGFSDLPESTLLRIQLLSKNNVESVYYAARISGGTFKLIVDPSIERNIYDARATVASLSQQPLEIQRWAERKFSLSEICEKYKPSRRRISSEKEVKPATADHSVLSSKKTTRQTSFTKSGSLFSDPGTDPERAREIEKGVTEWTEAILRSEEYDLSVSTDVLKEIYQRLLDLEVRIDQLIGLLESPIERNVWMERREDVYGSFIGVRQEIGKLYDELALAENPFRLEEAIRQKMRESGLKSTEVLVIDSPTHPNSFIIEIEVSEGRKEEVLVTLAEIVHEEARNVKLQIDRISLRYEGKMMWWTLAQIDQAVEALELPEGFRRCALQLELSSSSTPLP